MQITPDDLADYQMGYSAAQNREGWKEKASFWWHEGYNQAAARWLRIGLVVGAPPPDFKPFSVLSDTDVAAYLAGFRGAGWAYPTDWWYRVGDWDRQKGRPQRAVAAWLPAPEFHENPNTPAPLPNQQPGQPPPADLFAFAEYRLLASDLADYGVGWQASASGQPSPYDPWWKREGYSSQQRGRANSLPDGTTFWAGLAPLDQLDVSAYQDGYARGATKIAVPTPEGLPFWYRQGLGDAISGRGNQPYAASQIPVGFPVVVNRAALPPARTTTTNSPVLNIGGPALELLATFWGKPIAYNLAVQIGQVNAPGLIPAIVQAGTRFEFLGDSPGASREGFRLSGPRGPIARKIARLVAAGEFPPSPRYFRMPAWVGTHYSNGDIKLLGRGELQSIGMWDRLLELYPSAVIF